MLLAGALAAIGCGPAPAARNPNRAATQPETPPPIRKAATGPVKIEQRGEDRRLTWVVNAQESQLRYGGDEEMAGRLKDVSGTLYQGGEPASRFAAEIGTADRRARTLELEGSVRVRAIGRDAVLTARKVRWLDGPRLIEARGDVTLRTADYVLGPLPRLLATADLDDVGTPDHFSEATR
jgi:hypothetical protein